MKILSAYLIFFSLTSQVFAYDKRNESCIAVANRCETSDIASQVYFKCLNSNLSSNVIERCAYRAAGIKYSGNPLLMDLGLINSTTFLICIAR